MVRPRLLGSILALLPLALASSSGCRSASTCRSGTLFLTLNYDGVAAAADTIEVDLQLDGAAQPQPFTLNHVAGAPSESVEIDFNPSYPQGKTIHVAILARKGGTVVAGGTAAPLLDGSCAAISVSVSAGATSDGGLPDLTIPPPLPDLSKADLFGADLSSLPDLSVPPPDLSLADLAGADLTAPPADLRPPSDLAKVPDMVPVMDLAGPIHGVWDVTSWDNCVWN